jgi:hypothetical protein
MIAAARIRARARDVLVHAPNRAARDAQIDSGMEGGLQAALDDLEEIAISLS